LKSEIQYQIATLPLEYPENTDSQAWFEAARYIDQVRQANKTFQTNQQTISALFANLHTLFS